MMSEIKPGTLAIFSDCDAPCARMLCVVTVVRKDRAWGRYLSDSPKKMCDPQGPVESFTPVDRFGVEVELDLANYCIRTKVVGDSTATYRDGVPRQWQDCQGNVGAIKLARTRYWARWALNKQIARANFLEDAARIKARVAKRRKFA